MLNAAGGKSAILTLKRVILIGSRVIIMVTPWHRGNFTKGEQNVDGRRRKGQQGVRLEMVGNADTQRLFNRRTPPTALQCR